MGVQALWEMLCLSAVSLSDPVSLCFCPSLPVVDLSLSVSSVLHFHQSVPFLASACLHLTPPPITCQNQWFITLPNLYFHLLPDHFWHSLSLYCTETVLTQQFYMQQNNATPGPSTPSSGCLLQFPFKERGTASFIQLVFFFIVHLKSACHRRNNAILTIIICQ